MSFYKRKTWYHNLGVVPCPHTILAQLPIFLAIGMLSDKLGTGGAHL